MPKKASFPFRFVFDYAFYNNVIKEYTRNNITVKPSLLTKLMYINTNSKEHSRRHNVMSPKTFDLILKNNSSMYHALLRSSFYPNIESTSIESIDDEIERNIKHAIDIASECPYKTVILTSFDNEDKYLKNPHFLNVKEISVKSGEEALRLINNFWEMCAYK